ncbi:hypothetical protein BB558_001118 [Smittium angustum]|uniref:Transcription factor CBF/NF-Y/archaeal histone domain-containing protein n=1 Tax=Smittium angustum TaxID=133377 RepID=A0A2U1JCJ3_SMIAN|nr:hypothetical protein BB558_001118 [Smittium angustum]
MSDYEGGGNVEDDLSLPRATVYKLIGEMLPEDITCAKETRDLLIDCCNEFIHLVASEANEVCEKEAKKTIAAEHVLTALKDLGFESYIDEVKEAYSDHKIQQTRDRGKRGSKLDQLGMTQEELLKSQEELFAKARMRLQSQTQVSGSQGTAEGNSKVKSKHRDKHKKSSKIRSKNPQKYIKGNALNKKISLDYDTVDEAYPRNRYESSLISAMLEYEIPTDFPISRRKFYSKSRLLSKPVSKSIKNKSRAQLLALENSKNETDYNKNKSTSSSNPPLYSSVSKLGSSEKLHFQHTDYKPDTKNNYSSNEYKERTYNSVEKSNNYPESSKSIMKENEEYSDNIQTICNSKKNENTSFTSNLSSVQILNDNFLQYQLDDQSYCPNETLPEYKVFQDENSGEEVLLNYSDLYPKSQVASILSEQRNTHTNLRDHNTLDNISEISSLALPKAGDGESNAKNSIFTQTNPASFQTASLINPDISSLYESMLTNSITLSAISNMD